MDLSPVTTLFTLQVPSAVPDWVNNPSCIPVPSLTNALTWVGLGKYTAGIVSLGVAFKAALPEVMPWLNVPTAASSGWWKATYGILARLTGNYGKNAPVPVNAPMVFGGQPTVGVPAGGIVPTAPVLK